MLHPHKFGNLRLLLPAMSRLVGTNVALPTACMPFARGIRTYIRTYTLQRIHILYRYSLYLNLSFFVCRYFCAFASHICCYYSCLNCQLQGSRSCRFESLTIYLTYSLQRLTAFTHTHTNMHAYTLAHTYVYRYILIYMHISAYLFSFGVFPTPIMLCSLWLQQQQQINLSCFFLFLHHFFPLVRKSELQLRDDFSLQRRYFYIVVCSIKFYYRLK